MTPRLDSGSGNRQSECAARSLPLPKVGSTRPLSLIVSAMADQAFRTAGVERLGIALERKLRDD